MDFLSKMLDKTDSGFVVSPATAVTVDTITYVLGLKEAKVSSILAAGIPMMTAVAADDPQVAGRLFIESKKTDRNKTKHRKYAVMDYFAIFGDRGRPMSQAIAAETGASYGDVNNVMGIFLPSFVDAIEEENPRDDEALAEMFREDADEAKSESPGFANMAMKMAV